MCYFDKIYIFQGLTNKEKCLENVFNNLSEFNIIFTENHFDTLYTLSPKIILIDQLSVISYLFY